MKHNLVSSWRPLAWPLAGALLIAGCGDMNELIEAAASEVHGHGGGEECPDICEAVCAGEPEPATPAGCPIPSCACEPPVVPECPADFCERICAGEPEPELPGHCPIPLCSCE